MQTPAPTLPPPTPVPPLTPRVLSFTVDPTTTQNLGETLHLAWEAEGETAELCAIWGPGPTDCIQVPLSGETTRVVDQGALAYTGYGLHASAGGSSAWSIVDVHLQCQDLRQWFFSNPPQRCPENEAFHSYAAGLDFERGTMVWVEDEDMFYVFEDVPDGNGYRQVHVLPPLTVPGASPDNRVGENPPPGLYEPVSGFGLLWRGEIEGLAGIDLRQRLGWATEPEFGYDTAQQCSMRSHPRAWSCYMRGPHGEILRLWPDSTAGARTLWEEHASP